MKAEVLILVIISHELISLLILMETSMLENSRMENIMGKEHSLYMTEQSM